MNTIHQKELIIKCKQNNKRAQIELYRKYHQGMYNIAMRLLMNSENAEDIVQESFLKAFKNIAQFKADVSFGAWLKKIVINNCLNHLKKKKIELVDLHESYFYQLTIASETNISLDEARIITDVKQSINNLSDKYRFVLMLYLIEGYDHEEISKILNITVVASRTQLMRGKIKLRKLLELKGYGTED